MLFIHISAEEVHEDVDKEQCIEDIVKNNPSHTVIINERNSEWSRQTCNDEQDQYNERPKKFNGAIWLQRLLTKALNQLVTKSKTYE